MSSYRNGPPDYFDDPALNDSLFDEPDVRRPLRRSEDVRRFGAAPAPSVSASRRTLMPPPDFARAGPEAFGGLRRVSERLTAPRTSAAFRQSASSPRAISVSDALERLTGAVRGVISGVWIEGEVGEVKRVGSSGHVYFSVRDGRGLLQCVIWRSNLSGGPDFAAGDRIEFTGDAGIYANRGQLQVTVRRWRPAGAGSLYEAFLRLKAKLAAEGLFDPAVKRPLPAFVRRVAVVTSSQAAALRDVLRTLARRTPWVSVVHVDALVQGPGAPESLIAALAAAQAQAPDVILLVRGGGSYEDLQAFNDERLARAIAALTVPVVSGVGHETDDTIADFVADRRASTPTAAAEAIGPDLRHWEERLGGLAQALGSSFGRTLEHGDQRLDMLEMHLPTVPELLEPRERLLEGAALRLEGACLGAIVSCERACQRAERARGSASGLLAEPERRLERLAAFLDRPDACLSAPELRLRRAAAGLDRASDAVERAGRRLDSELARLLGGADRDLAAGARRTEDAGGRLKNAAEMTLRTAGLRFGLALQMRPDPVAELGRAERRLAAAANALALSDPDRPLRSGYARVVGANGSTVSRARGLSRGDDVRLLFADGSVRAIVAEDPRPQSPTEG